MKVMPFYGNDMSLAQRRGRGRGRSWRRCGGSKRNMVIDIVPFDAGLETVGKKKKKLVQAAGEQWAPWGGNGSSQNWSSLQIVVLLAEAILDCHHKHGLWKENGKYHALL
ncbi:unnamed protein product [Urochloa humidicola]